MKREPKSGPSWWTLEWARDLVRYGSCGILAAATDYFIWGLMVRWAGWSVASALVVSRPAGGLVSFLGNRHWTWRHRRTLTLATQFRRFWLVWALGYAMAIFTAALYAHLWPTAPLLSKLGADLTAALFGFVAQRMFTFR